MNLIQKKTFRTACVESFPNEYAPEFMYIEYKDVAKVAIHSDNTKTLDILWNWLELDKFDRNIVEIFWENVSTEDPSYIIQQYIGEFKNTNDYLSSIFKIPHSLENFINYDKLLAHAFNTGLCGHIITSNSNVQVFRRTIDKMCRDTNELH